MPGCPVDAWPEQGPRARTPSHGAGPRRRSASLVTSAQDRAGRPGAPPRRCRRRCAAPPAGRGPDVDQGQPPVGLLAHAAADHDQVRPEQPVDVAQVALDPRSPSPPTQVLPLPRRVGGAVLGDVAVELEVAQLGVGNQPAVDDQGAADAGAQGEHEHRAGTSRAAPKRASATPAASASLTTTGRRPVRCSTRATTSVPIHASSMLAAVRTTPCVTTAGRVSPKQPSGGAGLGEHLREDVGHRLGRGRLRRRDAHPLGGELPALQVDQRALDPAPADVDPEPRTRALRRHALGPARRRPPGHGVRRAALQTPVVQAIAHSHPPTRSDGWCRPRTS